MWCAVCQEPGTGTGRKDISLARCVYVWKCETGEGEADFIAGLNLGPLTSPGEMKKKKKKKKKEKEEDWSNLFFGKRRPKDSWPGPSGRDWRSILWALPGVSHPHRWGPPQNPPRPCPARGPAVHSCRDACVKCVCRVTVSNPRPLFFFLPREHGREV